MTSISEDYIVRFGTYETNGSISFRPWHLKNIRSITSEVKGMDIALGVPNVPLARAQIFDTSGPVRKFTISGMRDESDEYFSNYDFVHTQLNQKPSNSRGRTETYVGIEWLFSNMQVGLKGYVLQLIPPSDSNSSDDRLISGQFNVAIEGFTYDIDISSNGYNVLNYTFNLVERTAMGSGVYNIK